MRLGSEELEEVTEIKYLGFFVLSDSGMEVELKQKIWEGTKTLEGLLGLWKNIRMTTDVKVRVLETIMVPMSLYGSEYVWMMTARERRVEVFDMMCLSKVLGMAWAETEGETSGEGGAA